MDSAVAAPILWPLGLYLGLVLILVAAMIGLSYVLGERHRGRMVGTGRPYESGMSPTGTGRVRMPVEYLRVAVFFVVFDLESVFIYAGALVLRVGGWGVYGELLVFIGVLAAALVYIWRLGALDWGTSLRRKQRWHGVGQPSSADRRSK